MKNLVIILCLVSSALGWKLQKSPVIPRLEPVPRLYDTRIVGGTIAGRDEFPYQISLQKNSILGRYHFCGASILNANTVLTAAHCLDGQTASSIVAVAGEWDFVTESGYEQEVQALRLQIHESYSSSTMENDIGLIHLAGSFTFNDRVQATSLPAAGSETATGTSCTVSGWGTTSEGGSAPDVLHKVDVPVVSDRDCDSDYGLQSITDSMICAGGQGGKDSCQGDSGGPFYCEGTQVGIVSWGYGCARPNYPGVYTQVSYFINWINANK